MKYKMLIDIKYAKKKMSLTLSSLYSIRVERCLLSNNNHQTLSGSRPGIVLRARHAPSQLSGPHSSPRGGHHRPHFTNKETLPARGRRSRLQTWAQIPALRELGQSTTLSGRLSAPRKTSSLYPCWFCEYSNRWADCVPQHLLSARCMPGRMNEHWSAEPPLSITSSVL